MNKYFLINGNSPWPLRIILFIFLLRVIIACTMGLMPQDAYYYFYSEHLDYSYFDHPPAVAYMLRGFGYLLGHSVMAIKWTDFIMGLASLFLFFELSKKFNSDSVTGRSVLLFASTLMLTVLMINTTPDVPLIFFWTLTLLFLYRAIFEDKTIYWILGGLSMGLAFDSKYTALMLPAGLVLFLLLARNYRHYLFSYKFLLLIFAWVICISPVVFWNVQNDWMSFRFQSNDRASAIMTLQLKWNYFFGSLATQLALLLPVLFALIWWLIYRTGKKLFQKRKLPNHHNLFLWCFTLPTLFFFTGISCLYWVKLNWMFPAYISGTLLVSKFVRENQLKYQSYFALFIHLAVAIEIIFYPIPIKSDDTWWGWEELSKEVNIISDQHKDAFIFSDDGYKTTAILNYYLDKKIYSSNILGKNGLQYSVIDHDLSSLKSKPALYLDSQPQIKDTLPASSTPEILSRYFENIQQLPPILLKNKQGKLLRKFLVYKCHNYKGV